MTRISDSDRGCASVGPGAAALGARLRDMFAHVAEGPMPAHLMDLVDQLEDAYVARQVARARELETFEA